MSFRNFCRVAALGLPIFGSGLLLVNPAGAGAQPPAAPAVAPVRVEGFSPYLPQVSCDPVPKPGAIALRTLLLDTYGQRGVGITRDCAVGGRSEHKEGRALDWMLNAAVPADKAVADEFLGWLLAVGPDGLVGYNARRLGVMYAIWNKQVWSSYLAARGWVPYAGPNPHTDHVHFSLSWAGAMKQTSYWTGTAAAPDYGPCPRYLGQPAEAYVAPRTSPACPLPVAPVSRSQSPLLRMGSTGPEVAYLQSLLTIAADGSFGPKTEAALQAFQLTQGLPGTGRTDATTWSRLQSPRPATTASTPAAPPAPVAPSASPAPRASPSRVVPPTPRPIPAPSPRVDQALAPYTGLTLRQGARRAAVVALQKALRVTADDAYGPRTTAAVAAFNRQRRLPGGGVVRPATWRALGTLPAR